LANKERTCQKLSLNFLLHQNRANRVPLGIVDPEGVTQDHWMDSDRGFDKRELYQHLCEARIIKRILIERASLAEAQKWVRLSLSSWQQFTRKRSKITPSAESGPGSWLGCPFSAQPMI
jgi:hypothetical protein